MGEAGTRSVSDVIVVHFVVPDRDELSRYLLRRTRAAFLSGIRQGIAGDPDDGYDQSASDYREAYLVGYQLGRDREAWLSPHTVDELRKLGAGAEVNHG